MDKSSLLTLGTLYRPLPFVSAGVTYTGALNGEPLPILPMEDLDMMGQSN